MDRKAHNQRAEGCARESGAAPLGVRSGWMPVMALTSLGAVGLGEVLQIALCALLVGFLAALGNLYVQWTDPRTPGAPRPPLQIKTVLLPFVCLKMMLDGCVYYLWIQALDQWGLPAWGKVLITSGFYTPIYYILFFLGMEVFTLGPQAALGAAGRQRFGGQLWGKLKPIWRVDFWYFLVADGASFYGGPAIAAAFGQAGNWDNAFIFVIFSLFDFFYDVVLSRALRRGDGKVTEKHVYQEARLAADYLAQAVKRRRSRRKPAV